MDGQVQASLQNEVRFSHEVARTYFGFLPERQTMKIDPPEMAKVLGRAFLYQLTR
jgi:hypothetical protein